MPRAKPPDRPTPTRTERRRSKEGTRSRLWIVGGAVVSAAILGAWFPASALYHQRSSLAGANAQLHQLHQQDAALNQERKNLSNAAEIDRIAREQYQLVSPGQQAFEVLPPSGAAASGSPYAGDPGSKLPVAPSAPSELPPGSTTTIPVPSANHGSHSAGVPAAHSEGTLSRMLHALEFWR